MRLKMYHSNFSCRFSSELLNLLCKSDIKLEQRNYISNLGGLSYRKCLHWHCNCVSYIFAVNLFIPNHSLSHSFTVANRELYIGFLYFPLVFVLVSYIIFSGTQLICQHKRTLRLITESINMRGHYNYYSCSK